MREKYESLALADLKAIARSRGIKGTSAMKKAEVVEAMLELDSRESQTDGGADAQSRGTAVRTESDKQEQSEKTERTEKQERPERTEKQERADRQERPERTERSERERPDNEKSLADLDSGEIANGILEVMPDGYGFIRCENYLPGENDVYVAPSQIRRFGLKTGDIIEGNTRVKTQAEKFSALLFVKRINGYVPEVAARRRNFEDMTPIFPDKRLRMETPGASVAMRIMDLMSPVGKGQRGMIVSPPKAGKTT